MYQSRGCPHNNSWAAEELIRSTSDLTGELSSKIANPLQAVARELPQLMELDVSDCRELTSRGVACLSSLSNLKALYLSGCYKVYDGGRLCPVLDGKM